MTWRVKLEAPGPATDPPIHSPADALLSIAVANHQAAQLSTGISIRLRHSQAPGTIYKANRMGFSPYGRQRATAAWETSANRAGTRSVASNGSLIHS